MNRHPSHEEVERYDRQMRLWGEKDQLCIINTVVYFDYLSDLSCEVIKNLALKGIGKLVIGLVPNHNAVLHFLNRNNVFHILNGHDQVERICQLNPHVDIVISDSSIETERIHLKSSSVFVYHTISEAHRHQRALFGLDLPVGDELNCFCITSLGDLGRITRVQRNEFQRPVNETDEKSYLSIKVSSLERDISVVEKISREMARTTILSYSGSFINVSLPEYHFVLQRVMMIFKNHQCNVSDSRIGCLADWILSSYKTILVQMIHEKWPNHSAICFSFLDTKVIDLTVSMGVELCGVLGGMASQAIVDSIRRGKGDFPKTMFKRACIDAYDRCESVIID